MGSSKVNPNEDQSPIKGSGLPLPATTPEKCKSPPRDFTCIRINRCCLLGTIFVLLVAMSVTVLCLVAFELNPKSAAYILANVQFTKLNITNTSLSENINDSSQATLLSYGMMITVEALNPNQKISIFYQSIRMAVSYQDTLLGESSVAQQLYQGHKNATKLHIPVEGQQVMLSESAASGLKQAIPKNVIPLQIEVDMHVRVIVDGVWRKYISSGDKCRVEREGADKPWLLKGSNCAWKEYTCRCGVEVSLASAQGESHLLSNSCVWEANLYDN